jgi:DNA replication protein DnaC
LEDFDFDHQRSLRRDTISHLGTLDFIANKDNVGFLGPPGTGKTHLSVGLGIRACQAGNRTAFTTAAQWVARLAEAHQTGRLQDELVKLGRILLLIIDEVGYIPLEAEAANLFFQLVSSRYERASFIVTFNKPFGRWGEVFGDDVVAAAMITASSTTPKSSRSRATATGSRTAASDAPPRARRPTRRRSAGQSSRRPAGSRINGV